MGPIRDEDDPVKVLEAPIDQVSTRRNPSFYVPCVLVVNVRLMVSCVVCLRRIIERRSILEEKVLIWMD